MASLSDLQKEFTLCVSKLVQFAYENGYALTYGDAYRDPRVHGAYGEKDSYSEAFSMHKQRLAVDFNLFKGTSYLQRSEDYKLLGEYWKSLHPLARWGGDFSNADGNHFSFTYQGRA